MQAATGTGDGAADWKMHRWQALAFERQERFIVWPGGRRVGKSEFAVMWTLKQYREARRKGLRGVIWIIYPTRTLSGRAVDLVISTAACHKVDACEAEATHAFEVNALGARNLALACRDSGAALVYFSTDYVFGAERGRRIPYVEGDTVGPVNAYGVSKVAGEFFVRATLERSFIIRTAGLFGAAGSSGKSGNFVELMLRLATEGRDIRVVDDQRTTPTPTRDLAEQIAVLVERAPFGTITQGAADCR